MEMKRINHMIYVCVMFSVCSLFLGGCGSGKEKAPAQKEAAQLVYRGTELDMEGMEGEIAAVSHLGDKLYIQTSLNGSGLEMEESIPDESEEDSLYFANTDGSGLTRLPVTFTGKEDPGSLMAEDDGTLFFLSYIREPKTAASRMVLVKCDPSGQRKEVDITEDVHQNETGRILRALMIQEQRVAVVTESQVLIYNDNLELLGAVQAKWGQICQAARTADGGLACGGTASAKDGFGCQVHLLDVDAMQWGKTFTLHMDFWPGQNCMLDGMDYDFYYKDDAGIYGFDMEQCEETKLLDYAASGLVEQSAPVTGEVTMFELDPSGADSHKVYAMLPLGDDRWIGMVRTGEDSPVTLMLYEKADDRNRQVITYGAIWADDRIRSAAAEFNRKNTDYRIEFQTYENQEDPISRMNADIIAGNVPDILDLSSVSVETYAAKGILEDLCPYLEQDPELSENDFQESVLQAMKLNDRLYYVTPDFYMSTLAGCGAEIGDREGWTFAEFAAMAEKNGPDTLLFAAADEAELLNGFMEETCQDFVDWDTGNCSFDSREFRDILAFCNGRGTFVEDEESVVPMIRSGKIACLDIEGGFWDISAYREICGEDIAYIGYPARDRNGSHFCLSEQIGMYSGSKVKEGAWAFLRTFLTKEYQGKNMGFLAAIPLRKDCMEMQIRQVTAVQPYTDEFGKEFVPPAGALEIYGMEFELRPLTQEETDRYCQMIAHTRKIRQTDWQILNMIQEEAGAYFAGDKGLDETVDIIQNRVATYVNESR